MTSAPGMATTRRTEEEQRPGGDWPGQRSSCNQRASSQGKEWSITATAGPRGAVPHPCQDGSGTQPGYYGHLELQLRQCQLAYLDHRRRWQVLAAVCSLPHLQRSDGLIDVGDVDPLPSALPHPVPTRFAKI